MTKNSNNIQLNKMVTELPGVHLNLTHMIVTEQPAVKYAIN